MSGETPTDRYFPANRPEHSDVDPVARAIAVVALLLAVGLHVANYVDALDRAERDRAACVRTERDLIIEQRAWESIAQVTGLEGPQDQADRIERILERDCERRFPDPGII